MIQFGTSGWRGIVGEDFTFRNVRRLLDAIVEVLVRRGVSGEVVVSYDTRLLSEKFAREAVSVLTHHGIRCTMSDRDVPSPCLAWATRERGAALGVMFTASHNSAEYNGVKLYAEDGTLAPRDLTDEIEEVARVRESAFRDFFVPNRDLADQQPIADGYLASLNSDIDWEAVRASGIIVAVDPLFGTAREFLDRVLLTNGVPTHAVHTTKDPYFGGYSPECTPNNLSVLRELVRTSGASLGLATDGDGDRFGIVDGACRAVSPNLAVALLVQYLLDRRGVRGAVGRSISTTRLVDRIAAAAGAEVVETPVGFSHFGPLMRDGRIAIATEESAGLGLSSRLPERDGIFAAFLMAEMVAVERASLGELARRLFERHGTLVSRRVQLPLSERTEAAFERLLHRRVHDVAGERVVRDDRSDGVLLELADGSWVLVRRAGTEPRLRLYAEATSSRRLHALVRELRRLVQ